MSNHDPYSDRKRRSDSILASSLACALVRETLGTTKITSGLPVIGA